MLVLMQHSGSVQMAYKSPMNDVCGACKGSIPQGQYFTRHQAPDPRRLDYKTGKRKMVPYIACEECAPFVRLEETTGEISLSEVLTRAKAEAEQTRIMPAVVRTSTPHPTTGPLPDEGPITPAEIRSIPRPHRAIRPVRLEKVEDTSWLS